MKALGNRLLSLCAALRNVVRRKRKLCLWGALGVAVVVGGVWGYLEMQKRTRSTLEFAASQINQALLTKDAALLSQYVELEAMAAALTLTLEGTPGLLPPPEAGADTSKVQAERRKQVLAAITEILKGGSETKPEQPKERSRFLKYLEYTGPVFEDLKPPIMIPGDLLTQMTARPFTVQGRDGDAGVLTTTIEYPGSRDPLRLRLLARKIGAGWKVTEIANDAELVSRYKKNLDEFKELRESVFHALNARIREVMGAHCYILLCSVVVDSVQPDGLTKVIVHLEGTNIGRNTLLTAGLQLKLLDADGQELTAVPIGINNRIPVGTSFRQYYNLELDLKPEVAARLKPLQQLKATWALTSVSLDNRLFLFPKPLSDLTGKPS